MIDRHYVDPNQNSGRFAELEELESDPEYKKIYFNEISNNTNTDAGLVIDAIRDAEGNVIGGLVDGGDRNTIIVSSTGAGKTRRILSQYILSCIYALQSFVVHDPKGEVYAFFYKLLRKFGFKIKVLNLREPMTGDRLNFLEESARLWKRGEEGRALEIVKGIAKTLYSPIEDQNDMFWSESSINLFLCYFTIAATIYEPEYVTLSTIYRIHIEGSEKTLGDSRIQIYLDNNKEKKCYELGIASVSAPNETRQSIYAVFTTGLMRVILNEEISDMTTKSTFNVKELVTGKQPMALFIITRDEEPHTYSTVVASFINMIYTTLIDYAQQRKNNRLPRTTHFVLEEFGNVAKLENINDMLTASRSRGIRIVCVVQSLCQLHLTYRNELAEVIIGNTQNLVYMASTDIKLVKMISERCGTLIDPYTNERRSLLSTDRLTHLDKYRGETLMLLDRHYPYIAAELPDISMYKMVEPLERVQFKRRRKLEVNKDKFSEVVDQILDQKLEVIMAKSKQKMIEEEKNEKLTVDKMLEISDELYKELDRIIQLVYEEGDYANN